MKMPDPPEYVVYTDSELDMVRSQYFALLRNGKEKNYKMSKELCCQLVRNTITSTVAILCAVSSKLEMRAMSQKIDDYYPMLCDADTNMPYVSNYFFLNPNCGQFRNKTNNLSNILSPQLTIYTKMYKRLQNMRSPRKRQGSVQQRGVAFSADNQDMETYTSSSSDNTILLESSDDISEDNSSTGVQIVGKKMKGFFV